jgi:hypothetical protein
MADYIYMTNPAKIRSFLQTIQSVGIPDKLTAQSLSSLGYKSSNDRPLMKIMRELGFISSTGEPTDRWQRYRNKQIAGEVLAEAVKHHYVELYKIYPDAHLRDTEALRNFFSTHTKVSSGTLDYIVLTFKTLCELADFSTEISASSKISPTIVENVLEVPPQLEQSYPDKGKAGYTININIQLTFPNDATKETFDAFFESMKRHLIN